MKLLYAEDEPAMTEAVKDILEYHNYMVDAVSDGREALKYALAGDYDGIILDIMLPGKSGLEVLSELRQAGDRTPVLRRREVYTPDIVSFYDLTLDRRNYELASADGAVTLTRLEYRMMEALMLNRGIFLSTEELLVKTWGYDSEAEQGVVWVYLSNLRKRLASVGSRVRIQARRGVGYRLEAPDA